MSLFVADIVERGMAPDGVGEACQGKSDKGMAAVRDIGGKDADLAGGNFAHRPGVSARNTTRCLTLLEPPLPQTSINYATVMLSGFRKRLK